MARQDNENDNDEERSKALRCFYLIYNSLRKRRAIRYSGHFDLKGARMDVWEIQNNGESRTICRVRAETEADCYRMAAEQLKWEMSKENPRTRQP